MTRIRIFDTETSGMEPPAAVVIETGTTDMVLGDDGAWSITAPVSRLYGAPSLPPEVWAIHHITAADIEGKMPFDPDEFDADNRASGAVVLACHFYAFEVKFYQPTLPVICTHKAALRVWPDAPSHSNQALRYWLEDQGLINLDAPMAMPPHRAGPDSYVTAHILKALLATGVTGATMTGWTKQPALQPHCNLGKHKGTPWPDVPTSYLEWICKTMDLDADTRWNASLELDRRNGVRSGLDNKARQIDPNYGDPHQ